jgi:hypothetical protein
MQPFGLGKINIPI